MTYQRPQIERRRIVGLMASEQSVCVQQGGIWDVEECIFSES